MESSSVKAQKLEVLMSLDFFRLESPVFKNGSTIPEEYTGHGRDVSPPMHWSGVPDETRELVLICEDPDAPGVEPFTHWVVYNIQATRDKLPAGIPKETSEGVEYAQGENSYHEIGYRGPNPPPGGVHHYHFKLFALDTNLNLPPGLSKEEVITAMQGHIIAEAEYIGLHRFH